MRNVNTGVVSRRQCGKDRHVDGFELICSYFQLICVLRQITIEIEGTEADERYLKVK